MRKFLLTVIVMLVSVCAVQAKSRQAELEDSINCVKAIEAVKNCDVLFFAERMSIGAWTTMVDDDLNFVAVNGSHSMVQLVPLRGHFNGINLSGNQSSYKIKEKPSKKGDKGPEFYVTWSVNGMNIHAQVMMTLYRDTDQAMVTIMGAYSGKDITLYGKVVPLSLFPEVANSYEMKD